MVEGGQDLGDWFPDIHDPDLKALPFVKTWSKAPSKTLIEILIDGGCEGCPFILDSGLQAMMATAHLHGPADAATRILPAVAPLTIDGVTEVRKTALLALSDFSEVLKDHSKLLEDQAAAAGTAPYP